MAHDLQPAAPTRQTFRNSLKLASSPDLSKELIILVSAVLLLVELLAENKKYGKQTHTNYVSTAMPHYWQQRVYIRALLLFLRFLARSHHITCTFML